MRSTVVTTLLCICAFTGNGMAAAPASDLEHNARREREFIAFNPDYQKLRAASVSRLQSLHKRVLEREDSGQTTACSHQILTELKFLVTGTADFDAVDRRIRDLELVLAHPERESAGQKQSPDDGSWGACYDAWYLKLMASYDHARDEGNLAFHFLDKINSPESLTAYFTSVATSDVAGTGVDHLLEFNESLSDLMRMILHGLPKQYPWDPRLKQTMMDLTLHRLRNPATGWWGESYVRDGQVKFVDDLSTTFHALSYMEGNVPDLPKVLDTALAVRDLDFPVGWLWKGQYWNHNNMDVAALFALAWPSATEAQRQTAGAQLDKMLEWCLTQSLQPDGAFKPLSSDLSIEEANYFGVAFLARIGYFDRSRRFWTDREFPESESVRQKILANLDRHKGSGGTGGAYYRTISGELK